MSEEFADQVVVIAGASRGIGFGIARAFVASGARVVIAASSADNLARAADEIEQAWPGTGYVPDP